MRDNHDKLPEILGALKENENFFCVVGLERAEQIRRFRFGISHEGYSALKQVLELRPFDQMPGISYRHFFVPNLRRLENRKRVEIAIRVEQARNGKQLKAEVPEDLAANLKWFFELDDWSKADHLRIG